MNFYLLLTFCMLWNFVSTSVFIEKVECSGIRPICFNTSCFVVLSRARISKLSFSAFYPEPIVAPIAYISFHVQTNNTDSKLIIEAKEHLCKIFSSESRNQFMQRLFRNLGVKGVTCPLKGNVSVNKIPMNMVGFINVLPNAKYIGRLQLSTVAGGRKGVPQPFFDLKVNFAMNNQARG